MARRYVTRNGERLNVDETEVLPTDIVATDAENHPVISGLNKAASALTFGLLDTQASDKTYVQNLRKENPLAAGVGEVGGEVVQGLLVPEVKAVGLVGNLALKGGLSGIGSQISEAALTDKPVNAELLTADVLTRALTGAVVGKVFTSGAKLASKVAGKAGELAASERVINAASDIRANALKKSLKLDDDLFKFGESEGFFAATSHEGVGALASEAERKAGAKTLEAMDEAVKAIPDYAPLRARWEELSIETGKAAQKEMREIEKLFEQGVKDIRAAKTPPLDDTFVRGNPAPLTQTIPTRKPGVGGRYQDVGGGFGALGGEGTVAGKGQKVAAPVVEEAAPALDYGKAIRENADAFRKSKDIKEAAVNAFQPFDLQGAVSNAVLPGLFGGPKAVAGMLAKDALGHVSKQRGGYMVAKALEKVQKGNVLPNVLKGFQTRIETMLATAPGILGPFATVLGHAAEEGADALLAAHSALVQSKQGPEYLARLGLTPETPEQTKAYGEKLAMLEALENQRKAFETDIDKNARAFIRGDSFDVSKSPTLSTKDFSSKLATLQQTLRDPSSLAPHVPSDVLQGAPGLTAEGGQLAMLAAQFLVDRAPKPNDLWKPISLRAPFEPSKADIGRWQRYVDAAENPNRAASQIARGSVTPEALETVKTIYPNLFGQIQQRVFTQLSMLKKPLPYAKRQALANVFGPQIMGISQPSQVYLQNVHQASSMPTQPGQNPGQPTSNDGRQMVNTNKNMQTQDQRLQGRQ